MSIRFADAIRTSGEPRVDTPESVPVPPLVLMIAEDKLPQGAASDATADELAEPDNDLQRSLKIFAEHLEQNELPVEARAITITPDGPLQEEQRAKMKVLAFLAHQKAKAGVAAALTNGVFMQTESSYVCDSCGEEIVIPVDLSAGTRQEYVEDCPVCCRPNVIRVEFEEDGEVRVSAERE